ncbi:molybdopterin-dependent oxidoreductase [Rhizobium ruizarguesonis]
MTRQILTRRRFLIGSTLGVSALTLASCDVLEQNADVGAVIRSAETLTMKAQRLLQGRDALAREFKETDISPSFRVNGTSQPESEEYTALIESRFADWRLKIDGLVERPKELSLGDLRALPARTQITRHDCVEGWSAIGKWTGVPLGLVLASAQLKPSARFALFHCADELEKTLDGSGRYYESIDLVDAFHPQTILAYAMNGKDLAVGHGAPLRLRVERQLGYKQAKYVMRIEIVDSFNGFWGGNGGYWEDRGYEWYAGI